jgi:hypothetical protein
MDEELRINVSDHNAFNMALKGEKVNGLPSTSRKKK